MAVDDALGGTILPPLCLLHCGNISNDTDVMRLSIICDNTVEGREGD
jgi:hypothetical protein